MSKKPRSGDIVGKYYRLEEYIDGGRYGSVWKASNIKTYDEVALKFLVADFADNENVHQLFKQEFDILKQLNHPNINKVFDFGLEPRYGYYFVSELINGANFFTATKGLSTNGIEKLLVQIFRALAYLHARGIFHFDIKAKNILVENAGSENPKARLIDFGVATFESPDKPRGTPSYMAPEMILNRHPDGRADLYSMGVLLYTCLTRRNPFKATEQKDTYKNQLSLILPRVSETETDVPEYIDIMIEKLLKKDPAERYPSALHVISDLNLLSPNSYEIETDETETCYIPSDSIFVGRHSVRNKLRSLILSLKSETPGMLVTMVTGGSGTGKTFLLKNLKYESQLEELDVLDIWGAGSKNLDIAIEHVGRAITEKNRPVLVLIDDAEELFKTSSGATLKRLLDTYLTQAASKEIEPLTPMAIVYTAGEEHLPFWNAEELDERLSMIHLNDFTADEMREYILRMASPPEKHIGSLIEEIKSRTRGNPQLVTQLCTKLVRHGFLGGGSGLWDKSNFDDIAIRFSDVDIPVALLKQASYSLDRLSEDEKAAIKYIALWNGPVRQTALSAILPAEGLAVSLRRMETLSLINFDHETLTYSIKDKFTLKAITELTSEKEKMEIQDRIAEHKQATKKYQQYEVDLHISCGSNASLADAALLKVIEYERKNANPTSAMERLEARIKKGVGLDTTMQVKFALELCKCLNALNRTVDAVCYIQNMIMNARESGIDKGELADLYLELGYDQITVNEIPEGKGTLSKALELFTETGKHKEKILVIKNRLARALAIERRYDDAIMIYKNTLKAQKKLPKEVRSFVTNNELGQTYWMKGDYRNAVKWLKKSMKLYKKLGIVGQLARCHYTLAEVYKRKLKFKKAVAEYKTTIETGKELQEIGLLASAYNALGTMNEERGYTGEAVEYYLRALSLARRLGKTQMEAIITTNLGQAFNRLGQIEKAKGYLNSVYTFLQGAKARTGWMENLKCGACLRLADIAVKEWDFERSERLLNEAYDLARVREELKINIGAILLTKAELYRERFKKEQHRSDLEAAKGYLESAKGHLTTPAALKDLETIENSLTVL